MSVYFVYKKVTQARSVNHKRSGDLIYSSNLRSCGIRKEKGFGSPKRCISIRCIPRDHGFGRGEGPCECFELSTVVSVVVARTRWSRAPVARADANALDRAASDKNKPG